MCPEGSASKAVWALVLGGNFSVALSVIPMNVCGCLHGTCGNMPLTRTQLSWQCGVASGSEHAGLAVGALHPSVSDS